LVAKSTKKANSGNDYFSHDEALCFSLVQKPIGYLRPKGIVKARGKSEELSK